MGRRKRKPTKQYAQVPTREALARSEFQSAGMAYKRIAAIETMLTRRQIDGPQYAALNYYREQASLADKSPIRSCCDNSVRGGDMGPGAAIVSALLETARIERDLGSLRDITRAVAVNDLSPTQWCIQQHGGRERLNGKIIEIVPVGRKAVQRAILELKHAAGRIVR